MLNPAKLLVLRKHNKMTDDRLRSHAANVVSATDGVPAYESVATEAASVKVRYTAFSSASEAAANGGKSLTLTKNDAKKALLDALDVLGTALQLTVREDLTYITNAYYEYRTQPVRSEEPLPDPILEFVNTGTLTGTVVGKLKALSKGVKAVAIEHSKDEGETWVNGTYATGRRFTISGLEVRKDYLVRALYHGTFQRTSNPSKPMPVFVL
jgi:hypothetical protein